MITVYHPLSDEYSDGDENQERLEWKGKSSIKVPIKDAGRGKQCRKSKNIRRNFKIQLIFNFS